MSNYLSEPARPHFSDTESVNHEGSDHYLATSEKATGKKKWYKQRRTWIVCGVSTVIIIAIVVPILIFVALPKISQLIINGSSLNFDKVIIEFTEPANANSLTRRDSSLNMQNSFWMDITSSLSNTGPFPATLDFPEPVQVFYNGSQIGQLNLPSVSVSGGGGSLKTVQQFTITDVNLFGQFSKLLLSEPSFEWTLVSTATIHALGRTIDNLSLNKVVTLSGMNGFPNVEIQKFALPSNNPAGGIDMEITTLLQNQSPIGVTLGTVFFDIGYENTYIGRVSSQNVTLSPGNNTIILAGTMIPQNNTNDLQTMSNLFSRYIGGFPSNTTAKGVSAAPDGVNQVAWLSEGFTSLTLQIALQNPSALHLITGITIGTINFAFSESNPFAPIASSNGPNPLSATFDIPFGFSLNINAVENNLTMATEATGPIAQIDSTFGSATSNQNQGILNFSMPTSPVLVLPGKDQAFTDFCTNLTLGKEISFLASGNATVQASTPIGNVTLSQIPFSAPANLTGLNGLNYTGYPQILAVDVVGGTTQALQMTITTSMYNPSNVQVGAGDVTLDLAYENVIVGNVILTNLTLLRGENIINTTSNFNPAGSPQGTQLLTNFVAGNSSVVNIAGNQNSSKITPLATGLSKVSLQTTLNGLTSKLIGGTYLEITDQTVATSIAQASVVINNPFTAALNILYIKSSVSYAGISVGNINVDVSASPIVIPGKTSQKTSALPLSMNLQPEAIVNLLRASAKAAGLDTDPLEGLLQLGKMPYADYSVKVTPALFEGFNIVNFVESALANLTIDLQLFTTIQIGDYKSDLSYTQTGVPNHIDQSITKLIPVVGQPIVQAIVSGSNLTIAGVVLSAPTETSAQTQLTGSITNTGPLDATIVFGDPLQISWQNSLIGSLAMSTPVQAKADVGATLDVSGTFNIPNADNMESFTAYLLNNKDFSWSIAASNLQVTALGYTFTNITFGQSVSLLGINGFKDSSGKTMLTITEFGITGVDPAGGLTLSIQSTLTNPSTIGVNLNDIQFEASYNNIQIGPLDAANQLIAPNGATSKLQLGGRLVPQTSQAGLDAVSTIFSNFIHDIATPLSAQGSSASGPNGQVSWLTNAFKTLQLSVSLPGQQVDVIKAVSLKQLTLDFTTSTAYAPLSSSTDLEATIGLPPQFNFPLNIVQLSQNAIVSAGGYKMANLNIPTNAATTTGNTIKTSFSNVPFAVFSAADPVFNGFTKALTLTGSNSFELSGSANSVADTAVGKLTLNNITFDVTTTMEGFNDFGGAATLSNVAVVGGTTQYIIINLDVTLTNPSAITITVGDVNFNAQYQGLPMGVTYISGLTLKPGSNTVPAVFHMAPGAGAQLAAVALLSGFVQGQTATLDVVGTSNSTPIASLQDAFAGVKLTTQLQGINTRIIVSSLVKVELLQLLVDKVAQAQFTLSNPLGTAFTIPALTASVTYEGDDVNPALVLSNFTVSFPGGFTVPANGQATSPSFQISISADPLKMIAIILKNGLTFPVTIDQTAQILIGEFPAYLQYHEAAVPLTIEIAGLVSLNGLAATLTNQTAVTLPGNSTNATSTTSGSSDLLSSLSSAVSSLTSALTVPTSTSVTSQTSAAVTLPTLPTIPVPGLTTTKSQAASTTNDPTTSTTKTTQAAPTTPAPAAATTSDAAKSSCTGNFWGSLMCDVTSFFHG